MYNIEQTARTSDSVTVRAISNGYGNQGTFGLYTTNNANDINYRPSTAFSLGSAGTTTQTVTFTGLLPSTTYWVNAREYLNGTNVHTSVLVTVTTSAATTTPPPAGAPGVPTSLQCYNPSTLSTTDPFTFNLSNISYSTRLSCVRQTSTTTLYVDWQLRHKATQAVTTYSGLQYYSYYDIANLIPNTVYEFSCRGRGNGGTSQWSSWVELWTPAPTRLFVDGEYRPHGMLYQNNNPIWLLYAQDYRIENIFVTTKPG